MKIINATYGGKDCTSIVAARVKNNSLTLRSNNDIIGDPAPGKQKRLDVSIEGDDGKVYKLSAKEGQLIIYPSTKHDRLGIFYSNNIEPSIYPVIRASLRSIEKAANGVADIYTCMWNKEPENPFVEYIAWTKTSSHLNQLLQIMQLLYSAREIHPYKYVSFLEHDVLYPEGYFNYPEFNVGEVITNMNYIGMNSRGYQSRGQDDEPFHQMTIGFEDAIKHCESILSNALVTNSGLIEPQNMKRKQWMCKNSSIHINHGKHFTSHFNVYRKGNERQIDSYWGDITQYQYFFNK